MSEDFMSEVMKKRQARKQRQETKGGGFTADYEEYEILPLKVGKEASDKVFRIVGKPLEVRKTGTDALAFLYSQIAKDDKKGYMHIVWKSVLTEDGDVELDKEWILTRLYNKIMEKKWINFTEEEKVLPENQGKNGKYHYINSDKKSYRMIMDNARDKDKYPPKFMPKKRVVLNVIDRHDEWCAENKHTKVLFAKVNPWATVDENGNEKIIIFKEAYGIPYQAYDEIMDRVVSYTEWMDDELPIDIVMYATGKMNSAYDVRDAQEKKISEEAKKLAKDTPSSAEELAYERYDFDKIFRNASYSKLLKNKIALFKQADIDFNEHFSEELQKLADEKKKEMQRISEEKSNENTTPEVKEDAQPEEETNKREERENIPPKEESKNDIESTLPFINKLSNTADKEDILNSIDVIEDGEVTWKAGIILCPCDNPSCSAQLPNTVMQCPKCGAEFTEN